MASQARLNAYLQWKDFTPALKTSSPNSFTSTPFKNDSRPGVIWKLSVRNGNDSVCEDGHMTTCPTCPTALKFSLELEGGGEAKELEPELFVSLMGVSQRQVPRPKDAASRPSSTRLFADPPYRGTQTESTAIAETATSVELTCRMPIQATELQKPAIFACVSFKPREVVEEATELAGLVQRGVSRLLAEHKFNDFEIRVGKERIPIHRALFAVHSEVFARMFQRDMDEKRQGFVVIEDASAEAMRGLKTLLYSGRVAAVRGDLPAYLDLSEKYGIQELKDLCQAELRKTLSPSNLCALAVLADTYELEELFEDCRDVLKNPDGTPAVAEEDWDRLVQDHRAVSRRFPNLSFPLDESPLCGNLFD